MNTKFILPGSLALTIHAFVMFGLTGKAPSEVTKPDPKPPEIKDVIPVDLLDQSPIPVGEDENPPFVCSGGTEVPVLPDLPLDIIRPDVFTMPALPQIRVACSHTSVIPADVQPAGRLHDKSGRVIDRQLLDRNPRALSQIAPVYPFELRKEGIEGTVEVEFVVDMEGRVHSPVVLRTDHPGFVEAALRAIVKWRFEPGRCAGQVVRFRMSVPVVFKIERA